MKNGDERLERPAVADLDQLLGLRFDVLDDGFVRVVDYMGSDAAIVQAARVSYGTGTKRKRDDVGLIRYLMRHSHTTPFEMCEIKFHLRIPMDVWRQWIRHRTANVNEYSTRYSVAIDSSQLTAAECWRIQSAANRQGSSGLLDASVGAKLSKRELELHELSREVYEERLAAGVAREQARKDLPLSTYTEAYWKIDLHNLLHFLRLRMDHHAQFEIQQYARVIGYEIVAKWCPLVWNAFTSYQLNSIVLSDVEASLLRFILHRRFLEANILAQERRILRSGSTGLVLSSEGMEFVAKASHIGCEDQVAIWIQSHQSDKGTETSYLE